MRRSWGEAWITRCWEPGRLRVLWRAPRAGATRGWRRSRHAPATLTWAGAAEGTGRCQKWMGRAGPLQPLGHVAQGRLFHGCRRQRLCTGKSRPGDRHQHGFAPAHHLSKQCCHCTNASFPSLRLSVFPRTTNRSFSLKRGNTCRSFCYSNIAHTNREFPLVTISAFTY